MSARRLDLTVRARRDVRGILRDTLRAWGEQQSDDYERQLADAMERLIQFPELGRRVDQISVGLRAHRVGQHVIYYRVTDEEVRVFRLLHVKMDAVAQLSAESA